MKKFFAVTVLLMVIVLSGCGVSKKSDSMEAGSGTTADSTKTSGKYVFDDENCQSYVKLMECLIEKTPEAAKAQTASSFEKVMELRKGLDKSTLPATCKNTVDMLKNQKEVFAKAGCELK